MNEAAAHAEVRRVALVGLLHERAVETPPAATGGFDGGARTAMPLPRDPVRDHDELIVELALHRRVFGGGW